MAGLKIRIMRHAASIPVVLFFLLAGADACAQSPSELEAAEKLFGGLWVNKETTRCLQISFGDAPHATILDWTRKFQKRESGDVYKAAIRKDRLVMEEDKEYHVPYSEIRVKNDTLIYLTKSLGTGIKTEWDRDVFTRKP